MNPKPKTNRVSKERDANETDLSFGDLEFEEVLADLMQIKPVDNAELKKDKKSKKPKTKK